MQNSVSKPESNALSDEISDRIHVFRVLATFFVVGIHTNATLHSNSFTVAALSAAFDVLFRIAVPGFFLLTGALLLDRAEYSMSFYRRRVFRIMPAWVAWSGFYMLYRVTFLNQQISPASAVRCFIVGDTYYHLWFMPKLFGVYLALPALRILVQSSTQTALVAISLAYVFNHAFVDIGVVMTRLTGFSFSPAVRFDFINEFCMLATIGYFLRNHKETGYSLRFSATVFIISYVVILFLTIAQLLNTGVFAESEYFSSIVLPMSAAAFYTLTKSTVFRPPRRFVNSFSELCFGIYLAHPLVYELLIPKFIIGSVDHIPLASTLLVFVSSAIFVALIRMLPLFRHIV